MRLFLTITAVATLFYAMTGIVYAEGSFDGALVVKPRPMRAVVFGGGETGAWARHHPGQAPPWFMRDDLLVISRFSWEEGYPAWVTAYQWGAPATLASLVVVAVMGVVKLGRFVVRSRTMDSAPPHE